MWNVERCHLPFFIGSISLSVNTVFHYRHSRWQRVKLFGWTWDTNNKLYLFHDIQRSSFRMATSKVVSRWNLPKKLERGQLIRGESDKHADIRSLLLVQTLRRHRVSVMGFPSLEKKSPTLYHIKWCASELDLYIIPLSKLPWPRFRHHWSSVRRINQLFPPKKACNAELWCLFAWNCCWTNNGIAGDFLTQWKIWQCFIVSLDSTLHLLDI